MLNDMREKLRRAKEARDKARMARDRAERIREEETARAKAMDEDRVRRMHTIRVITGDVKYRYAIIDTIRAVGFYEAPGDIIDPHESTRLAITHMQEQAFRLGADAIIHAQYHLVRYAVQRRQMVFMPVYETHVFGTAIKVIGPPTDWEGPAENEGQTASE
ncbi:MAG: hypothetical protein WDO70_11180 [Alphaproteobacteria bacterium]